MRETVEALLASLKTASLALVFISAMNAFAYSACLSEGAVEEQSRSEQVDHKRGLILHGFRGSKPEKLGVFG